MVFTHFFCCFISSFFFFLSYPSNTTTFYFLGCQYADCDCPHCNTIEYFASRMKQCSKVTDTACVRLVSSRQLYVTQLFKGVEGKYLPVCPIGSLGKYSIHFY